MPFAPELVKFINYHSHVYARCYMDVEDNRQDAYLKILELEMSGKTDLNLQRSAVCNLFKDKSRAKQRKDKHLDLKMKSPLVETSQTKWDEQKIEEACSQLPSLEAAILRNMTDPSPEYKEALAKKYQGKGYVYLDESVLAQVLGIDSSTLSRHKDNMLIFCIKHFIPVTRVNIEEER